MPMQFRGAKIHNKTDLRSIKWCNYFLWVIKEGYGVCFCVDD